MILKMNYLFIFFSFYMFFTTEPQSPPSKGNLYYAFTKGKSKLKKGSFMNVETTSIIMNDVSKRYANYIGRNTENTISVLTNFIIHMITDSEEYWQIKQSLRILIYATYIATEYFYSLSLCMIWEYTTDSEANETLPFLQKLKEDGIIDTCKDKLSIFYNITTAYSEALNNLIQMTSKDLPILSPMKDMELRSILNILNCAISCMHEYKIGSYVVENFEKDPSIDVDTHRMNLYKIIGDNSACLESIRNYFNSSITIIPNDMNFESLKKKIKKSKMLIYNSIIDFRSNIITHSDESYSTVTPSISNNEQFLWRNVVDISNQEGDTNPFLILSKCEELRNEFTFYTFGKISQIPSFKTPREYLYPSYDIKFLNDDEFAIQMWNE